MWCVCETADCFIQWLDRWQTLISGVLALIAAGVAAILLNRQIRIQEKHADDERVRAIDNLNRRGMALRAKLPLALDQLTSYARDSFDRAFDPPLYDRSSPIPLLPAAAIEDVSNIIEFTDNESARYLAKLVANCQVNDARMRGAGMLAETHIIDSIILQWQINSTYLFARLQVDQYRPAPTEGDLLNAIRTVADNRWRAWPMEVEAMEQEYLPRAVAVAEATKKLVEAGNSSVGDPGVSAR